MAAERLVAIYSFTCLMIIACAYANPLPVRDIAVDRPRSQEFDDNEEAAPITSERKGRHGYYSYDYYPEYYYYGNYYPPPPPQPQRPVYAYYPTYQPVQQQQQQTHHRRPNPNKLEASYSLDHKKTNRRRYKPVRPVQATTQKYSIWDLAK